MMKSKLHDAGLLLAGTGLGMRRWLIIGLLIGAFAPATRACTQDAVELMIDPVIGQALFSSPELAAKTLVRAIEQADDELLGKTLGADYYSVLPLDEVDQEDLDGFIAAWKQQHSLLPQGENKRMLVVGDSQWTFPIPIVAGTSGWYFDIDEGLDRIRIRRIGRNELSAMQAVLAYYDAQMEYAERDRDGNGVLEYARRFISTPGKRDGLFWEMGEDGELSPSGPLLVDESGDEGYFGYHYRILEGQGEHAPGGAYSYLIGDKMRAGFALIAWPVEYGETGVMSFMVSHAGIVYERDLGPESGELAQKMPLFDPGPGWNPVKEVVPVP